jgi:hydroxyacylglutathione hydrolase
MKYQRIKNHHSLQAGARSAIGTSLLQAKGFKDVLNLESGFSAWQKEGLPVKKD